MSIYRYPPDSPIAAVSFHYTDGAPTAALIDASKTATAEQIVATRAALSKKNISFVPVTVDGRDMLQAAGFLTEKTLIDALVEKHIVKGEPTITREASDRPPPPKSAAKHFLENYSLRLAGVLNLVGDVAMHFGGYSKVTAKINKDTNQPLTPAERKASVTAGTYDLVGGGLYTLGGLNAAAFGNSKNDAPPLADRIDNFITHTANPDAVPLSALKQSGSFLRRNAADVTLGAYTVGAGVFLAQGLSGYRGLSKQILSADPSTAAKLKSDRRESASLMGYGVSSLLFKVLSLFIKEKPTELEEGKSRSGNPIVRVKDWFVEKPLRIFGLGSLITDSFYAKHTWDTRKSGKDYRFKIITTVSYFASDILAAISSKKILIKPLGADDERGVIARAAQSIAAQPQEKQDALIEQAAEFLKTQPEMETRQKRSIVTSLREQIQHLGSNRWAQRVETREPALQKQL